MAKICPETGDVVLYLTCLECEDKVCEKVKTTSDNNEEKMKIIIAGCRDYTDYDYFSLKLDILLGQFSDIELVSGGASGADALAERYARDKKIPITVFKAEWNKYGNAAGPIRNKKMIEYAGSEGLLIAFWDNRSRGTKNCIETARRSGMKVNVVTI